MPRFLIGLLIVTCIAHIPFVAAVVELAKRFQVPSTLLGFGAGGIGIALFLSRARAGMPDRRRNRWVVQLFDLPYFIHWCACIFSFFSLILSWPLLVLLHIAFDFSLSSSVLCTYLYSSGLAVAAYGILIRRRLFSIRSLEVILPHLPQEFDGYRIAHLSDLHIGTHTPLSWGERWVRAANQQMPDLSVVTGDLITSGNDYHDDATSVLQGLKAKDGAYVSLGNHDYFGDGEGFIKKMRAAGVKVLRNEGRILKRGNAQLYLASIDDTWTGRAHLDKALADAPPHLPILLLAHDPACFSAAASRSVALTLSGHTHGGQIALPFCGRHVSLSHLANPFHIGFYQQAASILYVHPGLGTTGPPIRIGSPPAVVILTLRSAPVAGDP